MPHVTITMSQLELASLEALARGEHYMEHAEMGKAFIARARQMYDTQKLDGREACAVKHAANLVSVRRYYKELEEFRELEATVCCSSFNASKHAGTYARYVQLSASLRAQAQALYALGVVV